MCMQSSTICSGRAESSMMFASLFALHSSFRHFITISWGYRVLTWGGPLKTSSHGTSLRPWFLSYSIAPPVRRFPPFSLLAIVLVLFADEPRNMVLTEKLFPRRNKTIFLQEVATLDQLGASFSRMWKRNGEVLDCFNYTGGANYMKSKQILTTPHRLRF